MRVLNEYTIHLNGKQGDDFRHYLDENDGNASSALRDWALQFKSGYDVCMRLAQAMDGHAIWAYASDDHISFEPADKDAVGLLDMLTKEELLSAVALDEDEEGYDDEDEDYDEDDDEESDDDDDDDDEESDEDGQRRD